MVDTLTVQRVGALRRGLRAGSSGRTIGLRLGPYPAAATTRWLVRLGFAIPYLAIAIVVTPQLPADSTVNDSTLAHVDTLDWGRADAAWVRDLYPPLGTVLVRLIPGGATGLAIAGALVAGVLLQQLLQVMVQRRFHWWKILVLLLAVAANPLFAYSATTNFEGFLSIALFGVAAMNMARFINSRNTQAGFTAGILFMLAALTAPFGLVLVFVAGTTAPWLALARKNEAGARWSNVLVVLFPTLSAFAAVMILELIFLHDPFAAFRSAIDYDPARWSIVPHLFTTLDGLLLLGPVVSGAVLALLSRRPGSILIAVLLFIAIILGHVAGLIPTGSTGNVFLVMTLLGISVIPPARTLRISILITIVGIIQIAIAWAAAFQRVATLEWMSVIFRLLGGN